MFRARVLSGLLFGWMAFSASAADPENFEQCLNGCLGESRACEERYSHKTLCRDHKMVCINRCDARRQHRGSAELLFPTGGRVIDQPRHTLSPKDRTAICVQDCDLGKDSCITAGNGVGLCTQTRNNCRSRCERNAR